MFCTALQIADLEVGQPCVTAIGTPHQVAAAMLLSGSTYSSNGPLTPSDELLFLVKEEAARKLDATRLHVTGPHPVTMSSSGSDGDVVLGISGTVEDLQRAMMALCSEGPLQHPSQLPSQHPAQEQAPPQGGYAREERRGYSESKYAAEPFPAQQIRTGERYVVIPVFEPTQML